MEYILIDKENIDKEHICCAISKKDDFKSNCKKLWLKERFDEGLVFYRLNERAKVFIEYLPIENAWLPIMGKNGFHINCLWVSGKYKGKGISNKLLDYCIEDGIKNNKDYISIISTKKKRAFLSDPGYLKYKGFIVSDVAEPDFELLYLPLKDDITGPKFKDIVIDGSSEKKGFTLYYTHQCPHTVDYSILIKDIAESKGYKFNLIHLDIKEKAQNVEAVWTTYSLYYNDRFISNEIYSEKKFLKLIENIELGLI